MALIQMARGKASTEVRDEDLREDEPADSEVGEPAAELDEAAEPDSDDEDKGNKKS